MFVFFNILNYRTTRKDSRGSWGIKGYISTPSGALLEYVPGNNYQNSGLKRANDRMLECYNVPVYKDIPSDEGSSTLRHNTIDPFMPIVLPLILILKTMKKDPVIKFILLFSIIMLLNFNSYSQEVFNPITDLPKEIAERYGTDIVPDEKTALKIAEIIFKAGYINTKFDKLKPFEIKLIADNRVWEVKAVQQTFINKKTIFCIRINKNTGEVLNFFTIK